MRWRFSPAFKIGPLAFVLGIGLQMRFTCLGPAYDRNVTTVFLHAGPFFGTFMWWHWRHDRQHGGGAC